MNNDNKSDSTINTSYYKEAINDHYSPNNLIATIEGYLETVTKESAGSIPDLAALDQFHVGGKLATMTLANLAGINKDMQILDLGGGLGGPARTLAREFGAKVTVLDLTEEYCRAGELLTLHTGLNSLVTFQCGNMLSLPFADDSFDIVWTQHSSMNISDKKQLYTNIKRVLRPQGKFVFHEWMLGNVQPIIFPVPWAREASISFLEPPNSIYNLLVGLGFEPQVWQNISDKMLNWLEEQLANIKKQGMPPIGLHMLLGTEWKEMRENLYRNLAEDRGAIYYGIFTSK